MKLKKKSITVTLLIIYVLALVIFLLLVLGKLIIAKNEIKNLITDIDVTAYLKENEEINNILNSKKIPKEIFDYVNQNSANELVDSAVDNLYDNNVILINESDVERLIASSIEIYEKKYTVDIYRYIKSDISILASNIANNINNKDLIVSFNFINNLLNDIYLFSALIICIATVILVFLIEKKNAFLLIGIINTVTSAFMFYFNKTLLTNLTANISLLRYIEQKKILSFLEKIQPIYSILFALGILLLFIYLIIYINRIITKSRIMYYDKYYGR